MNLSELAEIQTGYSFRSKLESYRGDGDDFSDLAVIQMKDLTRVGGVAVAGLEHVKLAGLKDRHLAQEGDLVFRSRGLNSRAALIDQDLGRVIVAAPLIRIRVSPSVELLPEYLVWFINQPQAQAHFIARTKGTLQRMITVRALADLEVVVPSLGVQSAIVEVACLSELEQALALQLTRKREQLVNHQLSQLIHSE